MAGGTANLRGGVMLQIWTQGLDRTDSGLTAYYMDW